MLVLHRNIGGAINIMHGDEVMTIRVCGVDGRQVKLSFDAPLSFDIIRDDAHTDKDGNRYDI